MKNNKEVVRIKRILSIFMFAFLMPFVVSAEETEERTYYVSNLGGNGLQGFYSYAYFQKTSEYENSSYKPVSVCEEENGVASTSDCLYWKYTYSVYCRPSSQYDPQYNKSCEIYKINDYPMLKIVYSSSSNNSNNNTVCENNGGYTFVRCNGDLKYVKRSTASYTSTSVQGCQNPDFLASAVKYGYRNYGTGYFTGCNTDYGQKYQPKICKCTTTTSETTTGYTYKNITTSFASIKNDKGETVDAYCISPGLAFPKSYIEYESVIEEFDLNKCGTEGANKYGCGIASIMLNAKEKGYDSEYATMITAFRLWAAKMGQEPDGNWSSDLVTTNPIYKTTAQKADAGYLGTDDKTLYDQYVIHATGTGLTHLQHAIELYNIASKGEFETWVPYITNGSTPIQIDENGKFEFVITTNFSEKDTTDIAVTSKTNGISLTITSKEQCGEYYCINVSGSVSGFDRQNCTVSKMNYELQYKDERNAMGAIGLLRPKNASNYQKFAFFDKSKIGQLQKLEKPILFECPPEFECDMPNIDYTKQTNGCHNEDKDEPTEGKIIDPTLECIINVKNLREDYDFTDVYVVHESGGISNDYCEVRCRETVSYNMYDSEKASSVRFIKYSIDNHNGNDLFATVTGDRQCVSEIDYDKWKADYEAANEDVRVKWNIFKEAENIHKLTTIRWEFDDCTAPGGCESCYQYTGEPCSDITDTETGEVTGQSCTDYYETECAPGCYTSMYYAHWDPKDFTKTNADGTTSTGTTSDVDGDAPECNDYPCSQSSSCTSRTGNSCLHGSNWATAKYDYYKALEKREVLLGYIQDCNIYKYDEFSLNESNCTFSGDSDSCATASAINNQSCKRSKNKEENIYYEITEGYDFNPTIDAFMYDSEYTNDIIIDSDVELTDEGNKKYCVGCKDTTAMGGSTSETLDYWTCSGSGTGALCTKKSVTVPKNTLAYAEAQKVKYFWQSQVFSSSVPSGKIVSGSGDGLLSLSDQNIFPLEIDKTNGTYFANVTHTIEGDEDRKSDVKFKTGTQGQLEYEENYDCDFIVDNEITIVPDPGDDCPGCAGKYGYYYRQIDLTNMFPSGVKTGTWSTVQAQALIADVESKGETIYTGTPDYEFIITPKNIRNIKNYNRQLESKNYGSGAGYEDFNLGCDCQTGICYCISYFLEGISDGGTYSDLVTVYKKNGITYRSGS